MPRSMFGTIPPLVSFRRTGFSLREASALHAGGGTKVPRGLKPTLLHPLYPVALSPKLSIAFPPLFPPWCVGEEKDVYSEEKLLTRRMES